LRERAALRGLLLLMDIRHPLTDLDRQLLDGCAYRQLPAHILLTKADKLSRGAALSTLQRARTQQVPTKKLSRLGIDAPTIRNPWHQPALPPVGNFLVGGAVMLC
jgi:GTP-binding protein EngB required for normal cell division